MILVNNPDWTHFSSDLKIGFLLKNRLQPRHMTWSTLEIIFNFCNFFNNNSLLFSFHLHHQMKLNCIWFFSQMLVLFWVSFLGSVYFFNISSQHCFAILFPWELVNIWDEPLFEIIALIHRTWKHRCSNFASANRQGVFLFTYLYQYLYRLKYASISLQYEIP